MDNTLQIRSCNPISLTVFGMGPFQEKPFQLDFTNEKDEGCNFFLLISPNGRGKTTLLEAMSSLMQILAPHSIPSASELHPRLWSNFKAQAQLDLRLSINFEGVVQEILLTLAAGRRHPQNLRNWELSDLKRVQTTVQISIAWSRSPAGWQIVKSNDPLVDKLLTLVKSETKEVYSTFGPDPITAPSLLYFDAYRDIPLVIDGQKSISRPEEWTYWPVHRFGLHGDQWLHSLDNLLVWLTWLNDKRYKEVQNLLNDTVFNYTNKTLNDIDRQKLIARINSDTRNHRLDQLSSGEKSMVQLLIRIHLHLATHSIIVIDELDAHLHPKWQHRLYQVLKNLIAQNPSLTLIITTHSLELVKQFDVDRKLSEENLRFGGYMIEKNEI
ncbi:MAG: AAA family ATPase [Magnetococcales bacterium]|nr:AAA family ATPase [Magnetococcales bacterium]